MPSIEIVASQIMGTAIPTLFLDTCILLDIIRSTELCLKRYAEIASELIKHATSTPPSCVLVVSSMIHREWNDNVVSVTTSVNKHFSQIHNQSSHFLDDCLVLGLGVDLAKVNYSGLGLAEGLRNLSEQLLDVSIRLDPDDTCKVRAFDRTENGIPPSRKGDQVKDSLIIEEYLAVCRLLESSGFKGKRVFCSSNTKDYCGEGKCPHPALALEFAQVGLVYKENLPGAFHELTH
jgi:hypothetical protein